MLDQPSLQQEVEQWSRAIGFDPNDFNAYVRRGMVYFKLGQIEKSIQDFDTAEKINSAITPYLWQRGLSFYYADRFEEGAKQFEVDLQVNAQDVEETVWRYLCIARAKSVDEARRSLLSVKNDPRPIMRWIYELYAGNCSVQDVLNAGGKDGKRGLFYSHLYLGLYYEAADEAAQARQYIVQAADDYVITDYMWYLAVVHKTLRGWETPRG